PSYSVRRFSVTASTKPGASTLSLHDALPISRIDRMRESVRETRLDHREQCEISMQRGRQEHTIGVRRVAVDDHVVDRYPPARIRDVLSPLYHDHWWPRLP